MARKTKTQLTHGQAEPELSAAKKQNAVQKAPTPKEMAEKAVAAQNTTPKAKRNAKDAVFINLFKRPNYLFQLYQSLHPEDKEVQPSDLTHATLESHMVIQQYNDLAFLVRNKLLILLEAQASWSMNIIIRILLYLADSWLKYINSNELDLYGSKVLELPVPEFYVVYTGNRKKRPSEISLKHDIFGGKDIGVDIRVKVLYGGEEGNILDQYVNFTKVLDQQFKIYGRNLQAVEETIRICMERNILTDYLREEKAEVLNIMGTLFDDEVILKNHIATRVREKNKKERKAREAAEKEAQKEREAREAEREAREAAEKEAREAKRNTMVVAIKNLVANANWSIEQAMDALGISGSDRALYASML